MFQTDEHYVCIYAGREANTVLFHHEGGVDVGDVDAKATKMDVGLDDTPTAEQMKSGLLSKLAPERQE